jgi:hypothetical protein
MKKTILILLNFSLFTLAFGQNNIDKQTSAIIEEGRMLYKSEMASWYGTDIFLEKFSNKKANTSGYFSYVENNISKCIFFSKGEFPKVIGTISFDSTYNIKTAIADGTERDFTSEELDLYLIRKIALAEIKKDTIFKTFENTSLNIIPIINKTVKKVYVLTGPSNDGVVIIGNDYLLTFGKNSKLTEKKQLHKNIIPINYAKTESEEVVTMHTHLPETGEFITATDICTILLYEKFAKWKQHIVISREYVSFWDCNKDTLTVLTKKAWDKINNYQKESKKE